MSRGLSLAAVARRAGTSPATLSRYENGWTRFETFTLRKLASALDCELCIELRPKPDRPPPVVSPAEAVERFKRLFWDHPLSVEDIEQRPAWLIERILDLGQIEDVQALIALMGKVPFLQAVATIERLSPRTREFWHQILALEGLSCTKKFSRDTAWNS